MINNLKEVKTKEEVFDFLSKWLLKELETSERLSRSDESFEKPSWSEYQAYQLGIQKTLSKLISLIPTKEL